MLDRETLFSTGGPSSLPSAAALRDPIPSTWGSGEASFGDPEALLVISIVVLLLLLAGRVVWRIRRSPRNRSKKPPRRYDR